MKISIISTIYNSNKYLPKYFESLCNALSGVEHEIILINDNSPENPNKIINIYKNKLNIIYKLSRNNIGIGKARIMAYKLICDDSTHFTIIDPDDYIHSSFLFSNYSSQLQHNDVISFNNRVLSDTGKVIRINSNQLGFSIARKYGFKIIEGGKIWGHIFKNNKKIISIISNNARYHEDLVASNIMRYSNNWKITITNHFFIEYIIHPNSLTSLSKLKVDRITNFAQEIRNLLILNILPTPIKKRLIYEIRNSIYIPAKITIKILQIKKSKLRFFKLRWILMFVKNLL